MEGVMKNIKTRVVELLGTFYPEVSFNGSGWKRIDIGHGYLKDAIRACEIYKEILLAVPKVVWEGE